jgi:hypothetical protein
MENQVVNFKRSKVVPELDLKLFRDNALIVGIGTQPILKLSENKMDENMDFTWFLMGYSNAAFTEDTDIVLKDNVILTDFPRWRIVIEDNKETINHYKDLFVNLSRFDRTELNNRNKECGKVLIKEYFLVPAYMITSSHATLKLDSYIEDIKSKLNATVRESGIVLTK